MKRIRAGNDNMNTDYERRLEAGIRRELNALGELAAPPVIAPRVLRVIERRAAAPWHRREWPAWPATFRAGSLAGLLAAFAFLCFGSWRLAHLAALAPAAREVSDWFSLADAVWKAAETLATALALALRSLGPAAIIGSAAILLVCGAACVGLGTIYLRLALAPLNGRST